MELFLIFFVSREFRRDVSLVFLQSAAQSFFLNFVLFRERHRVRSFSHINLDAIK